MIKDYKINKLFYFIYYINEKECLSKIFKKIDVNLSYGFKLLHYLEKKEILITKKTGRKKNIILTEKGKELQVNVINILNILNDFSKIDN